jgi:hypothetical protein
MSAQRDLTDSFRGLGRAQGWQTNFSMDQRPQADEIVEERMEDIFDNC